MKQNESLTYLKWKNSLLKAKKNYIFIKEFLMLEFFYLFYKKQ
jgi:hypothetical protein